MRIEYFYFANSTVPEERGTEIDFTRSHHDFLLA